MLPTLRHRLLLGFTAIVGSAVWLQAVPTLRAADLSGGLTLTDPAGGAASALIALVVWGIPAIGLAVACAAAGSPVSGPFAIALALCCVAAAGGPIDGVLRRAFADDRLGTLHAQLALELLGWALALGIVMSLMHRLRPALRGRLPRRLVSDDAPAARWSASLAWPGRAGCTAGLISAAAGGLLGTVLIRSGDTGQVVGGLLLAFTVAGALGRMLVNDRRVIGILLSPCLVGIAGYLWVWRTTPDGAALIARYYAGDLTALGLALPLHYASAGVLGAALGVGIGQGLLAGSHAARTQASLDPGNTPADSAP